ncbi:MAG: hypothetical protein M1832_006317 [Thelocarpon impressellum]|nr:MAG: hypothetical protein M1832_006317 [Thelocarpon impressellum]
MPPPTAPDDLVGRLNALRAPSTKLEASHAQDDVDAVLARRFEALGGSHHDTPSDGLTRAIADSSTVHSSEDAETVEQLLAELGPEDQWTLDGDEQGEQEETLRPVLCLEIIGPVLYLEIIGPVLCLEIIRSVP